MMMMVTGSTFALKLVLCGGKNGEGDQEERKSEFHGWQWMADAVIVGVEIEMFDLPPPPLYLYVLIISEQFFLALLQLSVPGLISLVRSVGGGSGKAS